MVNTDYAWLRYAQLQQCSRNVQSLTDYACGLESALNLLLVAIETSCVPADPEDLDAAVNRAIASGRRLYRSRSAALKKWGSPAESICTHIAPQANIELARIARVLKPSDGEILFDAGVGYTDREIACRHLSTPGAIRTRLSRLRLKLTTQRASDPEPIPGATVRAGISKVLRFHSQTKVQAA